MLHHHNHITVLALVMLGLYEYRLKTVYSKFIITYDLTLFPHFRLVTFEWCRWYDVRSQLYLYNVQSCQHDLSVITTHDTLSAKLLSIIVPTFPGQI